MHPTIFLFQKNHGELIAILPSAFFLSFYGKPVLLSSTGQGAHRLELVSLSGLEIQELQDTELIASMTMYLCVSKGHSLFPLLLKKNQLQTLHFEVGIKEVIDMALVLEVFIVKSKYKIGMYEIIRNNENRSS